ncbi:unnamed protein product [Nesidiocoris tenuis]|uniref:Uncharacterized protein n=1 Tax=Nesidiocoris tenuis TaxID=355587 RepID=A0A6H5G120_9HEMI|nr:unnamed protein product [Nesidiocoris tenuis]
METIEKHSLMLHETLGSLILTIKARPLYFCINNKPRVTLTINIGNQNMQAIISAVG